MAGENLEQLQQIGRQIVAEAGQSQQQGVGAGVEGLVQEFPQLQRAPGSLPEGKLYSPQLKRAVESIPQPQGQPTWLDSPHMRLRGPNAQPGQSRVWDPSTGPGAGSGGVGGVADSLLAASGRARGAINEGLKQTALGAIEVPVPFMDPNPTAADVAGAFNPLPTSRADAGMMAAIPFARQIWSAVPKNMVPHVQRMIKDAGKVGMDKMDDMGMLQWRHKVARPGIRVPVSKDINPEGFLYHHSMTGENHGEMMKRLGKQGIPKSKMERIGYFFGEVITDNKMYKSIENHVDDIIAKTRQLNPRTRGPAAPRGPAPRGGQVDPRQVDREIRTGAGPAAGASVEGRGDFTTGIKRKPPVGGASGSNTVDHLEPSHIGIRVGDAERKADRAHDRMENALAARRQSVEDDPTVAALYNRVLEASKASIKSGKREDTQAYLAAEKAWKNAADALWKKRNQ